MDFANHECITIENCTTYKSQLHPHFSSMCYVEQGVTSIDLSSSVTDVQLTCSARTELLLLWICTILTYSTDFIHVPHLTWTWLLIQIKEQRWDVTNYKGCCTYARKRVGNCVCLCKNQVGNVIIIKDIRSERVSQSRTRFWKCSVMLKVCPQHFLCYTGMG